MLLVVDVGNTNISFGVFEGAALLHHVRCESARARTADEYKYLKVLVRQMLDLRGVDLRGIDSAIVASVVPTLTDTMVGLVRVAFGRDALVVGPGIKTGMAILYDNPREVGADRIVNAVAAYEWARAPVIVVDFGTATTFDCVTPKGEYLGGVIAPGVQISADALFSRAARLHRVEARAPAEGRRAGTPCTPCSPGSCTATRASSTASSRGSRRSSATPAASSRRAASRG